MSAIMSHPWMNEGHTLPLGPARFPNKLESSDLNTDIVQHMVWILKVNFQPTCKEKAYPRVASLECDFTFFVR